MSLSTNNGTGLKAVPSPSGLKLSSSPFTSQPDQAVAVVDVYQAKGSVVVNSIQEDAGGSNESFFDKIKNSISGVFTGLTGGLNLSGGAAGALGTLRSGTNVLRQITNVAARSMSAVNQMQKGGVMGTVGGLATLGGMGGYQGASQIATMTRGTIGGLNQGGLTGYLRAGNAVLGGQGNALGQLAGNLGSITRAATYMKSASNSGNFSSVLSGVDYSLSAATSTLSSLDRASQINFDNGFNSVLNQPRVNARSYNQSAVSQVTTALGDFTGSFAGQKTYSVPTRAGTITGLAVTGSALGNNSIYSLARSQGLDDESAFLAGSALTTHASMNGNIGMLKDLVSDSVGLKAVSSAPNALKRAVTSLDLTAPTNVAYKSVYDDLDTIATKTGQSWNTSQRNNQSIYDLSAITQSNYARQMVSAKAASDDFQSRVGSSTIDSRKTTMSAAQLLSAVSSVPAVTAQSILANNPRMSVYEASQAVQTDAASYSGA